jgi:lipopolysaccharide export system protein LptC
MSEAAIRKHEREMHWAVPGSRHDKLVRGAKIVLPSAVGVLIAFLALAPLDKSGDVSFILDKNKAERAAERMRVETARYTGQDDKGQNFEIVAQSAVQQKSDVPVVDIVGIAARLGLAQGPVTFVAPNARYDLSRQEVAVDGPVRVNGPDEYRVETRDVRVDLKSRTMRSNGAVEGSMKLGQFQAQRMAVDLGERRMVLDGGARLKIVQGAVR